MSGSLEFDSIVYFGDSLTDSGEFFELASRLLTFPLPSVVFGYDGQFSNGDVYADIAPELLGIDVENYAVGGARAVGERLIGKSLGGPVADAFLIDDPDPADLAFDLNLAGQVDRYLADTAGTGIAPGTAASLLIGLNDLNAFTPTSPATAAAEAEALVGAIIQSILTQSARLAGAGVETIILNTVPPASFFPIFQFADPLIQALGDQVVAGFNAALEAQSAGLTALGVNVEIVDLNAIAAEVMADPSAFGFVTVTQQKWFGTGADPFIIPTPGGPVPFFPENPAVAGLDEDQFAFWDLLHPTAATHGIFGVFSAESLTSEVAILGAGDESLAFGSADDLVLAGAGNDALTLGSGDDVALAGLGNDAVRGGRGNDIVSGGSGQDELKGGNGIDILAGGADDDVLSGGNGRDVLIGGAGADIAKGGNGADLFFFTDPALEGGGSVGGDVVVGGRGHDTLFLALSEASRAAVEAELAGQSGRTFTLASIGIEARSIEEVVILDGRGVPEGLELGDTLGRLLHEADLWGMI